MSRVRLEIVPQKSSNWDDLKSFFREWTARDPNNHENSTSAQDTEVYLYEEGLTACLLSRGRLEEATPRPDSWAGRLFNLDGEARWERLPGGEFQAWLTREQSADKDSGEPAIIQREKYYLIGQWGEKGPFREGRYPDIQFDYPIPSTKPSPEDRAYIEVAEYLAAEPDWNGLDEGGVQARLDAPLLIGHRFLSVGVGQD